MRPREAEVEDRSRTIGISDTCKSHGDLIQGLVPGYRSELALTSISNPLQRILQAVRRIYPVLVQKTAETGPHFGSPDIMGLYLDNPSIIDIDIERAATAAVVTAGRRSDLQTHAPSADALRAMFRREHPGQSVAYRKVATGNSGYAGISLSENVTLLLQLENPV